MRDEPRESTRARVHRGFVWLVMVPGAGNEMYLSRILKQLDELLKCPNIANASTRESLGAADMRVFIWHNRLGSKWVSQSQMKVVVLLSVRDLAAVATCVLFTLAGLHDEFFL